MNANLKKLIQILSDGCFHSGTKLGAQLGLTRVGVWKLIQQMQALSIGVTSKTNKGYQVVDGLELFSLEKMNPWIDAAAKTLIQEIVCLETVSSTNDFLLKHPPIPLEKALICLAESQTAGRGRFGRSWVAPYGRNFCASLLWCFPGDAGQLAGLSLAMAVSLVEALHQYGIQGDIGLKWPNDILWRGKKLGGCLIETRGEAYGFCHTVIGIGLNLDLSSEVSVDQAEWVDVRQMICSVPERNRLAGLIFSAVLPALKVFQKQGFSPFKKAWEALNVSRGQRISLVTSTDTIQGIHCGVDDQGCLLLQNEADGTIGSFSSGEVSSRQMFCAEPRNSD